MNGCGFLAKEESCEPTPKARVLFSLALLVSSQIDVGPTSVRMETKFDGASFAGNALIHQHVILLTS